MRYFLILLMLLMCNSAWSATQLKKTVCPSGCDYTSLEACMNANEQNLVTADKYFDVEISGTWSSADTTAVTIHNYTTDATRYINIYTTGDARHNGVWSDIKYSLVASVDGSSFAGLITISESNITFDGIQIKNTFNTSGRTTYGISFGTYSGKTTTIKSCIFSGVGTISNSRGIGGDFQGGSTINIYNSIFYELNQYGIRYGTSSTNESHGIIYNTTVYGCTTHGISVGVGTVFAKNVISYNNGTDYSGNYNSSSTNNLSKDATAPAYNTYYTNKTLTFTNTTSGSEDFHLVSTDTDAIDKGADLGSPYNTDIIGTSRPQGSAWDIGAFEFVAQATTAFNSVFQNFKGSNFIFRKN